MVRALHQSTVRRGPPVSPVAPAAAKSSTSARAASQLTGLGALVGRPRIPCKAGLGRPRFAPSHSSSGEGQPALDSRIVARPHGGKGGSRSSPQVLSLAGEPGSKRSPSEPGAVGRAIPAQPSSDPPTPRRRYATTNTTRSAAALKTAAEPRGTRVVATTNVSTAKSAAATSETKSSLSAEVTGLVSQALRRVYSLFRVASSAPTGWGGGVMKDLRSEGKRGLANE